MIQAINSPFRYAGGKFYARKLILEYIPPHSHYVEPFAGGASIFFAKDKAKNNWLNDIDEELINVYLFIRDYPERLVDALKDEVATKERHFFYKNIFQPQNSLEKATRWYYLNRTSYSGIMNMKNCYWGYGDKYSMRPENWGKNIIRTSGKLQGVRLTQLDFEEVIHQVEDDSFLFIDPPYFNADQDKFYSYPFSRECHYRLCNLLKRSQNKYKFLLTYDNSPEIQDLYSWATVIHEKEWNYTINRTDDQKLTKAMKDGIKEQKPSKGTRYKGREIFITNYAPTQEIYPLPQKLAKTSY
ncbi:DNA adenine methylase [Calothrix sp. NIES-3974]|uniref:DNA adenine methylase n=1 Tax=Calothrix sp. NIES-3974 TaxID=2005462 RepID=UPI000B5F12D9|nr:Dam family site-specific DNA-(adenine-N6)-methyltransferase [Calothrix sp. NIES-3974]BAZ04171.1 D12 class N6 adenine-specific DNA methyltransferase [Calothrix sp. NIES-3974]